MSAIPMRLQARFDQEFTTNENRAHWTYADAASIDSQASASVRRTLRTRCRYEYHNNPFFMGGANRLARFVIGTGPRLHMSTTDKELNERVEASFHTWAKKIRLAEKLRTSRAARFYNGEGFGLMRNNPGIRHRVQLDLHEIECDQVTSPLLGIGVQQFPDQFFDGIVLDQWHNPITYHVLRQHPGAFGAFMLMGYEFDPWPARFVIHDYKRIRPGQQRGVPEAIPALDLFAELRRYRKAVTAAAETAADHAGFIKYPAGDDGPSIDPDTGFGTAADYVAIKRRMMAVLPAGADAFQMKAEQPTTTYDMFTMALLMEISQTLDMPLFIFTGDARMANMSSAYVASQSFIKSVQVDRQEYEIALDRLFDEWIVEAQLVKEVPRFPIDEFGHAWRWDRIMAHADPQKMATAQQMRLESGVSSIPAECALDGADWEEVQEADAKALGMEIGEYRAAARQKRFAQKGATDPAALTPEPEDTDTETADTEADEEPVAAE